jgi:trehalose 6-phosphate synthase
VVADTGVLWVAAAMTDTDRDVAANGVVDVEGFRIRLVSVDATTYREAYDVVCNANLWFVHHGLFDDSHHQGDDDSFARAWSSYRTFNAAMADAVAADAPQGAVVLVQDYHLTLVALYLADRRRGCATSLTMLLMRCCVVSPPMSPAVSTPGAGPSSSRRAARIVVCVHRPRS